MAEQKLSESKQLKDALNRFEDSIDALHGYRRADLPAWLVVAYDNFLTEIGLPTYRTRRLGSSD